MAENLPRNVERRSTNGSPGIHRYVRTNVYGRYYIYCRRKYYIIYRVVWVNSARVQSDRWTESSVSTDCARHPRVFSLHAPCLLSKIFWHLYKFYLHTHANTHRTLAHNIHVASSYRWFRSHRVHTRNRKITLSAAKAQCIQCT